MKIRTSEMLSDKLSRELSWRKKELTGLKYLVEKSPYILKTKGIGSRCGIALLYAHWEGFVKIAARYYLEFVSMQRLKNAELSDNLLTLIINHEIGKRSTSKRASQLGWIIELFIYKGNERSIIPYKSVIDTAANLSSKILKEIVWCLGLDYSFYESSEKFIDAKLLGIRNYIAHGEKLFIDVEDYLDLHERVIELMNIFKNQLENAAITKSFYRHQPI